MPRHALGFIFDSQEGRALINDGDGEMPLGLERLGPLLAHLRDGGHKALLRRFAANVASGLPWSNARLVDAARSAAEGETDVHELAALRAELRGTASAASAIGLRHGAANAASFMCSYEACATGAYDAAVGASRMAVLYAEMSGGSADAKTRAHIDRLLDALYAEHHARKPDQTGALDVRKP